MHRILKKYLVITSFVSVLMISCQARIENDENYNQIKSFLNQYTRDFTLLDIRNDNGQYALPLAYDYNNVICVIAQKNDALLKKCKRHKQLNNLIMLNTTFKLDSLQHLGECERFDVTLAGNILKTFEKEWQKAIDTILNLGDYVLIEVFPEEKEVKTYILEQGGYPIDKVDADVNSQIYVLQTSNNFLKRKTWLRLVMSENNYYVDSTFTYKQLIKKTWSHESQEITPWIPGINLCTFKMCCGSYPTAKQLKKSLLAIKNTKHTDWLMNNIIVQGNNLALIDYDDYLSKRFYSKELLQAHEDMLNIAEPEKVEQYFWHILTKIPVSKRHIIKLFKQLFSPCSLVFDIGSPDTYFIDHYLGYGAKVICYDVASMSKKIENKYKKENVFFVPDKNISGIGNDESVILRLTEQYGKPQFCMIHKPIHVVKDYIKKLSKPIKSIAFKFNIKDKVVLEDCLEHLVSIGYTEFNFSARYLPGLILQDNPYIEIYKDWVTTVDGLLFEIDEFAKLDKDDKQFWGYIYARSTK